MRIFVAALCAFAGSAFGAERTFPVKNAATAQPQQDLATLVRAVLEIADIRLNSDASTLTVSGTEAQIAAAEWLLGEMDKPASRPGDEPSASSVYRMDGVSDGVLRVLYVKGGRLTQQLQESATVIRAMADIRRVYTYNQTGGIALRGTLEQIEAAEWIWRTIETDTPLGLAEYRAKWSDGEKLMRAYRMPMEWSAQELEEAATLLRAIIELRRLFTYSRTRTILIRGDDARIAAANWLAVETTRPASATLAESGPFQMDDPGQEGLVRVFRLPAARFDAAKLQRVAVDVRREAQIRRVFTFNSPRMIVLRGTDAQMAQAEGIVRAAQ